MARFDVAEAKLTTSTVVDYSVDTQETDGPSGHGETVYDNAKWTQYLGYYKTIPEIKITIDKIANWTAGRGWEADEDTTFFVDSIRGIGFDTFNTILENCVRVYKTGGDSFCEIIRDDIGAFVNLKPLNPGRMRIVADDKGMIIRFEQTSNIKGKLPRKFELRDIFFLPGDRFADEIHGTGIIEAVEQIILMKNEAMTDNRTAYHRNVVPQILWYIDEENTAKISAFETKINNLVKDRENIIIPMGTVQREVAAIAPNATLNPIAWIELLNKYLFQATGMPTIIVGSSQELTEASAKIVYLAFEQTVKKEQLWLEEQCSNQLGITIKLTFPASLQNELLSGSTGSTQNEDGVGVNPPQIQEEQAFQENDQVVEVEGRQ